MTNERIEEMVEEFRKGIHFVSPCCSATLYFGGNHHIFCHGCIKEVELNSALTALGDKLKEKLRTTLTTVDREAREEERQISEALWDILDDIDTRPDMTHPHDLKGWEAFGKYVMEKVKERHKFLKSDGFILTPNTPSH